MNSGGKRKNSGRKKNTKKTFTIRCKPINIKQIREYVKLNRL